MSRWAKVRAVVAVGSLLAGMVPFAVGAVAATQKGKKPVASAKKSVSKEASSTKKRSASRAKASSAKASSRTRSSKAGSSRTKSTATGKKRARSAASKKPTAQTLKLTSAFRATEQLRPMAQQLASTRSAAAYRGVENYARQHPGEGAAAAYLALGHAYMLDRKYAEAVSSYRHAKASGTALDDYADYLGAQAALQAGRGTDAYALLDKFAERHPDSIFNANAPVLLANAYIQQSNPQAAVKLLLSLSDKEMASHNDFRYALGRAYQTSGDDGHAAPIFRKLYVTQPLSYEATQARTQLLAMGLPLTAAERKSHADQLFNARRYSEAGEEYQAIKRDGTGLSAADHDALLIYSAVCQMKLKRIGRKEVERLPETTDDSAALKQYMLAELSRADNDESGHNALIEQMVKRFPTSRWLEEALYSGGNMYILKHDAKQATY
ncbi:MAG: tetratricopeptide repeat protein, partial [Edaphobacter sp.]